jgi:hypothetical protein
LQRALEGDLGFADGQRAHARAAGLDADLGNLGLTGAAPGPARRPQAMTSATAQVLLTLLARRRLTRSMLAGYPPGSSRLLEAEPSGAAA